MDFLEEEFDEILNIFQVESDEIISRLNNNLLALEKKPNNKDAILMLFRDAHSLKGAARMIGFNNVQTLAHKIEDILGLAKEGELQFNPKIVDILYKTVDFISELIQKSVKQKKEFFNDEIPAQISALENIKDLEEKETKEDEKTDVNVNMLHQKTEKINEFITECLFNLMEIEINKNDAMLDELLSNVNELFIIFQDIGLYDIKKNFEDISVKLEFVTKVSHTLTEQESEELQQTINNVITDLTAVFELYNIEMFDYYGAAFQRLQEAKTKPKAPANAPAKETAKEAAKQAEKEALKEIIKEAPKAEIVEELPEKELPEKEIPAPSSEFSDLKEKIQSLSVNNNAITEIKTFLENFKETLSNTNEKEIIQTIINILDFAYKNQVTLNEETIAAINQGIESGASESEKIDKGLILQRLEVIQQILEFNVEESSNQIAVPKKDLEEKNGKIDDFSSMFDSGEIKTLRVDSAKLDKLINQVGELMVTKIKTKKHLHELNEINKELEEWQRSSQKALSYLKYYDKKYFNSPEMIDTPIAFFVKQLLTLFSENNKKFGHTILNISNLYRTIQEDDMKMNVITDDLEHLVKNVRVLPLATVFHLFGRMVRDIAKEKGKQIDLEIIGSETSTDKKIIEEIKAPLIHMIRNAIDHGIETPEERIALGKNPTGKIILKAKPLDNNILIELEDDGRGINIEKIKEKALQKGYLTQDEINLMTNEQITNIIFAPGFSTGDEITSISGRGIGLDVVQTKISKLNGKVRILSEINKGCCVQIELPTTMSTLKAFLVKSADQTFAIPMNVIKTVGWKENEEIFSNKGNKSIIYQEKTIPLYDLADVLKLPKKETSEDGRKTVLIIESDNKTIGLSVDKLIGDQEILHKKLSAPLYKLKNISGVTTLVSGEICLIINISDFIKTAMAPVAQKSLEQAPKTGLTKNKDFKILLVDDSITTRTLEKNILTQAGYQIETATNPIEAFETLQKTRFDLIISDIEMPEMDGFEFLEKLKTDEMYFDIPAIIVSSLVSDENKKRAKEAGAQGYIVKSEFGQEEFLEKISEILKKKSGE